MYKEYLDGTTGIEVPWNVVTPSLRSALVDVGVPIKYGKAAGTNAQLEKKFPNERYSLNVEDFYNLQFNDGVNPSQTMVFKDEVREAISDIFNQVEAGKKNKKSLNFKGIVYSYNHVIFFENKGREANDYDIIKIIDADSLEAKIHEAEDHDTKGYKGYIDRIAKIERNENEVYCRSNKLLEHDFSTVEMASRKKRSLIMESFYPINNNTTKKSKIHNPANLYDEGLASQAVSLFEEIVSNRGQNTRAEMEKNSLNVDSNGNNLTESQAEYFKDSKVRDENGNLMVMYHGSTETFTEFDKSKIRAVANHMV